MTMATKAGLIGLWRIDRHIADERGPDARFSGTGTFAADPDRPDTLRWSETGALIVGTQPPATASQSHVWHFRAPDRIDVTFADGRPFHNFDPTAPCPRAEHDCPPDLYRVEYAFCTPREWRAVWQVRGPRKAYLMTSVMTRA